MLARHPSVFFPACRQLYSVFALIAAGPNASASSGLHKLAFEAASTLRVRRHTLSYKGQG